MMHEPCAKIAAQRRLSQLTRAKRLLQGRLESPNPSMGKFFVRQPDELSIFEKTACRQTVHGLFILIGGVMLCIMQDREVNHDNEGFSGRSQRQNAVKLGERGSLCAGVEHRGVQRLLAGKMFVNQRFRNAGSFRQLARRCPIEALLSKNVSDGLHNGLTPLIEGEP